MALFFLWEDEEILSFQRTDPIGCVRKERRGEMPKKNILKTINDFRKRHDALCKERMKCAERILKLDEEIKEMDGKIRSYEKIQKKIDALYAEQDQLFSKGPENPEKEMDAGSNIATDYVKNVGGENEQENYNRYRAI